MGVRKGRWDGLFIGKVRHQISNRAADIRQPQQTSGNPNVHPVVFVQWSKGCLVRPGITQRVFQKVAYVQWSHVRPPLRFAKRTSCGSRLYVRAKDKGVCSADLAYVYLLRVSVQLLFSKGSRGGQVNTKGFKSRLSGFIKGSC